MSAGLELPPFGLKRGLDPANSLRPFSIIRAAVKFSIRPAPNRTGPC